MGWSYSETQIHRRYTWMPSVQVAEIKYGGITWKYSSSFGGKKGFEGENRKIALLSFRCALYIKFNMILFSGNWNYTSRIEWQSAFSDREYFSAGPPAVKRLFRFTRDRASRFYSRLGTSFWVQSKQTKKQLRSVCSLEVTISVSFATAFTLTSESVACHGEIRRLYFHRPLQHQLFGVLPALLQSDPRAEGSLHGRDLSRSASSEILPWEIQRGEEGGGVRSSVSRNTHLCCCCPTD